MLQVLSYARDLNTRYLCKLKALEEQYGDGAYVIGAEAAKNALRLQQRLRELAGSKFAPLPKPEKPPYEPSSPAVRGTLR